jgi:hypothetical protein
MGKVTFLAAQVPANPTYNWSPVDPTIGMLDIGVVSVDAPGPGPAATGLQNIATSILPRPVFQSALGQIIRAWDPVLGFGEFIYLQVPNSTAIPLGTMVSWGFGAAGTGGVGPYQAVVMPVKATGLNTGAPAAVCVSSTVPNSGLGITSNTTQAQYAWFQCGGAAQVLKTAIQVPPVLTEQGAGVYLSTTVGRVKIIASTGAQILGARLGNTTTVTSTASCVLVYLNGRPAVEGF